MLKTGPGLCATTRCDGDGIVIRTSRGSRAARQRRLGHTGDSRSTAGYRYVGDRHTERKRGRRAAAIASVFVRQLPPLGRSQSQTSRTPGCHRRVAAKPRRCGSAEWLRRRRKQLAGPTRQQQAWLHEKSRFTRRNVYCPSSLDQVSTRRALICSMSDAIISDENLHSPVSTLQMSGIIVSLSDDLTLPLRWIMSFRTCRMSLIKSHLTLLCGIPNSLARRDRTSSSHAW